VWDGGLPCVLPVYHAGKVVRAAHASTAGGPRTRRGRPLPWRARRLENRQTRDNPARSRNASAACSDEAHVKLQSLRKRSVFNVIMSETELLPDLPTPLVEVRDDQRKPFQEMITKSAPAAVVPSDWGHQRFLPLLCRV
jgi:hypothetical protein